MLVPPRDAPRAPARRTANAGAHDARRTRKGHSGTPVGGVKRGEEAQAVYTSRGACKLLRLLCRAAGLAPRRRLYAPHRARMRSQRLKLCASRAPRASRAPARVVHARLGLRRRALTGLRARRHCRLRPSPRSACPQKLQLVPSGVAYPSQQRSALRSHTGAHGLARNGLHLADTAFLGNLPQTASLVLTSDAKRGGPREPSGAAETLHGKIEPGAFGGRVAREKPQVRCVWGTPPDLIRGSDRGVVGWAGRSGGPEGGARACRAVRALCEPGSEAAGARACGRAQAHSRGSQVTRKVCKSPHAGAFGRA